MKIIGYGICGPGEAKRYLRETLEELKRLCDDVVILTNNVSQDEIKMIDEYGFARVSDRREWGKWQWKIKEDFIQGAVAQRAEMGDMLVCLDMDETFDKTLTREWLLSAPLDAYHVFIVDLWNDPQHYKPESCFWNVRIWRWNGETTFHQKPVHCGLAPEWAYKYHRFAPFLLLHKGLMDPENRKRKVERYELYDPEAKHLSRVYYNMLKDDTAKPLDLPKLRDTIEREVATYQQTKPRQMPQQKKKERYAYVRTPSGAVVDIPERSLQETLRRKDSKTGKGFEFINWADEVQQEMEEMFGDDDVPAISQETYQRSAASEAAEVARRNAETNIAEIAFSVSERVEMLSEGLHIPVGLPHSIQEDGTIRVELPPADPNYKDVDVIVPDEPPSTPPPAPKKVKSRPKVDKKIPKSTKNRGKAA